jgi:hypothetical protein
VITIGASQNFLFSRMNCQSSLTTNNLDIFVLNVDCSGSIVSTETR